MPIHTVDAVPALPGIVPAKRAVAEKRKRLSVPAVILLLLASVLVGAGATLGLLYMNGQFGANAPLATKPVNLPAPGSATTPGASSTSAAGTLPAPSSFQSITSTQLQISLQYPGDWLADPLQTTSSGNISISLHPDPNKQIVVDFNIGRLSATNSSSIPNAKTVNDANIQGFGQAQNLGTPQTVTNAPPQRTIGGVKWDAEDVNYDAGGGTLVRVESISVKYKTYYYNILFFALSSQFDDAMQKYYTQMLGSFKFTV